MVQYIRKQRGHGFATSVPILGISNAAQVLTNLIKKQPEIHYGPQNWIGYHEFMDKQRRQYKNNPKVQTGGFLGSLLCTVTKQTLKSLTQKAAWLAAQKGAEAAARKAMQKLGRMRLNRGKGLRGIIRRRRKRKRRCRK